MLRILSILLVLGGLLVAGLGGAALLERYAPKEMEMAAVESAPIEDMATDAMAEEPYDAAMPEPEPEAAAAPAAKSAASDAVSGERMAAPAGAGEDFEFQVQPTANDDLNFKVEMEEGPGVMMPPSPGGAVSAEPEASPAIAVPEPTPSFEDTLKTVPVAHETPRTAEYKRQFNVTFAIDATGDETAADALPGRGMIAEGEAKVSDRVEVRLSGAGFEIVETSPGIQKLSPITENTWRWAVTPMTAGEQDLTFEIFAIDTDSVTPLRTYRDTVTVKVSGINRAIAFADQANPLFVLLGGLGSAIAGLFGAIRFFGKR
ncbi:hypothetical protein [Hyphomonas sp.]|uniref:hypothetical protein n=1 Tax=Hyphomonas sp. TaxID=87 RepID=UPI0025C485CB|nr:hypothetical protein [Hyphomonas sp.]MBI1400915.1 hypothetical protein [Hyphomonas sp.]